MEGDERAAVRRTVERLIDEVSGWPHVEVGEHRFGGTEFRVGSREVGHVHEWGMLDVAYVRPLRDRLVETGATGVHHLLDDSGWTTYYVRSAADFERARWLLRLSYLSTVWALSRTPAGREAFADVDVEAELDRMTLDRGVRAAVERRPRAGGRGPEAA